MSPVELASPFVPLRLLTLLGDSVPAVDLHGAVLAADLIDFTGLTEAFTQLAGTEGGEHVGHRLHEALAPAVDLVMQAGGDVVKFAGDGLLCVFPGPDDGAAQRAADAVARLEVQGPAGTRHCFRVAVVQGPLTLMRLGGQGGRYELVAGGPAVDHAQQALAGGAMLRVLRLPSAAPDSVLPVPLGAPMPRATGPLPDLRAFLPAYLRERLTEDLAPWLREFRTLTLVFASFETPADAARLQQHALDCLAEVDRHAGQLLRFGLEGGGLVAEIAFGLALGPHAAGAADALQCAAALARAGDGGRVGVSTGRVLLGPVGSPARRQLTSLGSAINLAARLMQQAGAGEVLVDEATWPAAGQRRMLGERRQAVLKGLGLRSFHRLLAGGDAASGPTPAPAFFGREAACAAVRGALAEAALPPRPVVIEGEAGIGKSRFARWLADELRARASQVFTATCTPVGRDSPYASLAPVIAALCGVAPDDDAAAGLDAVAQRLLGDAGRAALLRDALGLSRRGPMTGADVTGHVRAENIREALVAVFDSAGAATLVIEDAHWLDSTSWMLLQRLAAEARALRLVIVTRPLGTRAPPALRAILEQPALAIDLQPLADDEIVAVVAQQLRVQQVPPLLAQWITGRVRGNPFFAQELAAMLAAISTLAVQDGSVVRMPGAAELDALPPAPTIDRAIEQRIDRLGADDALVLKLASVIGPEFGLDELAQLGRRGDEAALAPVVQRLVAAEMAVPGAPGRFAFRHRYTQETAYGMLPGDQRRELHARVAGWLEARLAARAEERAGDLAHHWYCAERWPQAANWLERAGRRALATGADSEAATHFQRALSLADAQPVGRRAAWHRQLAQALFGLGQVDGVAAEARRAFELVAHPLPTGAAGWTGLALATTARRIGGSLLRVPRLRSRPDHDDPAGADRPPGSWDRLEGARAAALLAESAYFVNAPEMMLAAALLAVDMAERTRLSAPVSTAYGMLAVVLGMARLHATARRYLARAHAIAEAADDPYQRGVAWFYSGIYQGCVGDWQASREACRRGLEITDALGAYMLSGRQLTIIATNALYTSDYADTRAWMHVVHTRAERLSNVQQLGWSNNVLSVAELHQGRYAEAITLAEQAREIFVRERDTISLTISEGVRCAALARSGRLDAAREGADRATGLIAGARPTTWGQLEGFAGPCEVYALLLSRGLASPKALRDRLSAALGALRLFALVFPFGRPRYHWLRGQIAQAAGRPGTARRHLVRAIATARRFGMPYEEWRATELLAALPGGQAHAPQVQVLQARVADGRALQAPAPAVSDGSLSSAHSA